jgi:hypothetical protein
MKPSSHLLTERSRPDPVETSSGRGTSCIGAEYGWLGDREEWMR